MGRRATRALPDLLSVLAIIAALAASIVITGAYSPGELGRTTTPNSSSETGLQCANGRSLSIACRLVSENSVLPIAFLPRPELGFAVLTHSMVVYDNFGNFYCVAVFSGPSALQAPCDTLAEEYESYLTTQTSEAQATDNPFVLDCSLLFNNIVASELKICTFENLTFPTFPGIEKFYPST